MKKANLVFGLAAAVLLCLGAGAQDKPSAEWQIHDMNRPMAPVITPGPAGSPVPAPSDAVVLFDGKDLAAWQHPNGKPADWLVSDGYAQVKAKSGDIQTAQAFGDCQVHVEWATPDQTRGQDQEPGNSGVFLMTLYEIQVLDSYRNRTYPDGQAGAVYCQWPPLVDATLPPGAWQTYDIVFHGPRFSAEGDLTRLATATVFHNGVLVQDHVTLTGPTEWVKRPPYRAHASKMPLRLQDHGQPVRYRNIWIREIPEARQ
jgi:hypothetical protein